MNIIIVDDSIVYRSGIKQALADHADINVVGTASNGKYCLSLLNEHDVDVITLDLEMPTMDGLETIKEIRKINKDVAIIVFSALSLEGASKTLEALNTGANDFATKVTEAKNVNDGVEEIKKELLPKILQFQRRHNFRNRPVESKVEPINTGALKQKALSYREFEQKLKYPPSVIVIGSSTGGPNALKELFTELDIESKIPMFVVQHMPPVFTLQLSKSLNAICKGYEVVEAKDGEVVRSGVCYLAPGDYHMLVVKVGDNLKIKLNQEEKVCSVRPSVDVLFDSIAKHYKQNVVAGILTGMGEDGLVGCQKLNAVGATIVTQSEETCVVYGMPQAVDTANLSVSHYSPGEMGKIFNELTKIQIKKAV